MDDTLLECPSPIQNPNDGGDPSCNNTDKSSVPPVWGSLRFLVVATTPTTILKQGNGTTTALTASTTMGGPAIPRGHTILATEPLRHRSVTVGRVADISVNHPLFSKRHFKLEASSTDTAAPIGTAAAAAHSSNAAAFFSTAPTTLAPSSSSSSTLRIFVTDLGSSNKTYAVPLPETADGSATNNNNNDDGVVYEPSRLRLLEAEYTHRWFPDTTMLSVGKSGALLVQFVPSIVVDCDSNNNNNKQHKHNGSSSSTMIGEEVKLPSESSGFCADIRRGDPNTTTYNDPTEGPGSSPQLSGTGEEDPMLQLLRGGDDHDDGEENHHKQSRGTPGANNNNNNKQKAAADRMSNCSSETASYHGRVTGANNDDDEYDSDATLDQLSLDMDPPPCVLASAATASSVGIVGNNSNKKEYDDNDEEQQQQHQQQQQQLVAEQVGLGSGGRTWTELEDEEFQKAKAVFKAGGNSSRGEGGGGAVVSAALGAGASLNTASFQSTGRPPSVPSCCSDTDSDIAPPIGASERRKRLRDAAGDVDEDAEDNRGRHRHSSSTATREDEQPLLQSAMSPGTGVQATLPCPEEDNTTTVFDPSTLTLMMSPPPCVLPMLKSETRDSTTMAGGGGVVGGSRRQDDESVTSLAHTPSPAVVDTSTNNGWTGAAPLGSTTTVATRSPSSVADAAAAKDNNEDDKKDNKEDDKKGRMDAGTTTPNVTAHEVAGGGGADGEKKEVPTTAVAAHPAVSSSAAAHPAVSSSAAAHPAVSSSAASSSVRWYFKKDLRYKDTTERAWAAYSSADSDKIELAHAAWKANQQQAPSGDGDAKKNKNTKKDATGCSSSGLVDRAPLDDTYLVDFRLMVQMRVDDEHRQRPVRRKEDASS